MMIMMASSIPTMSARKESSIGHPLHQPIMTQTVVVISTKTMMTIMMVSLIPKMPARKGSLIGHRFHQPIMNRRLP